MAPTLRTSLLFLSLAASRALAAGAVTELPPPDGYTVAGVANIAADGTVVGMVWPDGLVVRWPQGGAPEVLGGGLTYTLENIMPFISKDAATIVTTAYFEDGEALRAAPETWSGGTDWAMLPGMTLGDTTPFGISWDGHAIGGGAYPLVPPENGPWPILPWTWTVDAPSQQVLGMLADMFSAQVWALSGDGSVAAGFGDATGDDTTRWGVRWVDGQPQWLVDGEGAHVGQALACDADCSVVVGAGVDASSPQAWRWTAQDGVQYLGTIVGADPSSVYYAFEASADGATIVGSYYAIDPNLGPVNRPFVWTQADGMRDLVMLLADHGVEYGTGFADLVANAITPDGKQVLLNGIDSDFHRHRAVVRLDALDDRVFADGFDPADAPAPGQ